MKGNQRTIHDDLAAIDWSRARWGAEVVDKAHGRLEVRRCAAVDLDAAQWNGRCDLYGRRQAARVERERTVLNTGQTTREVAYCLTSLGADQAGPPTSSPASCAGTGKWKTGSTPCATSATTRTAAEPRRATCHATWQR